MAKNTVKDYDEYIVKMTQNSVNDLNEIIDFISKNNPRNAEVIMEKIYKKIKSLNHFPNRGGYVPELLLRNIKDYRQITEEPWKIIYKVNGNKVNISAIIDSRRNLKDILIKKLLK